MDANMYFHHNIYMEDLIHLDNYLDRNYLDINHILIKKWIFYNYLSL